MLKVNFKYIVTHHCNAPLLGLPSLVGNLTAVQQDQCSIFIQWNPPYLLPGLSVSYKVYVNREMIQDDISTTNYTYYPFDEGVYNISVQGFHQLIHGDVATTMVNYCKGKCNAKFLKL